MTDAEPYLHHGPWRPEAPEPPLALEPYPVFDCPRRPTLVELLVERDEWKAQGEWRPAHGGTETPFTTRSGRRLLYCYQPRSGRHAYLDVGTDMIMSDDDARLAMAMH